MSLVMLSGSVFCLIGAAIVALVMAFSRNNQTVDERFADLAVKVRASQGAFEGGVVVDENLMNTVFKWAAKRVPAPKAGTPEGEKLSQTLAEAGYLKSSSAVTFQVIRFGLTIVFGVAGLAVGLVMHSNTSQPLLFALAGAVLGYLLPQLVLARRARARQQKISSQLSDVLDLLVVCVEAGLGLYEAIRIVGTECERQGQVIGTELGLVSADISSGATLGQAVRALADRTAVEDIKPLAATLVQSEQLGSQIGPALRSSSDALRMRRRLRAEEDAQKASVKMMIPLVVFVLPAMISVIIGPALIGVIKVMKGAE
ncbi:MAG: type II secretion system F family protein [Candidatus Binataceae bacterium]